MEKKNFTVKKSLRSVPSQGMVEQAKKHGSFRPQRGNPGYAWRPPGGLQIKAAEILGNEELLQVRGKDMVADEVQYHRSRYKDYTNVVMKQRLTYERSKFLDGKAFAKFFQTVIEDRIMKGEIICLHKLKGMFIGVAREICPHEASNFCSVHFKEKQVVRYPQLQFIRPTGWNV